MASAQKRDDGRSRLALDQTAAHLERNEAKFRSTSMTGDVQQPGGSRRNPLWLEIGRHLAAVYEDYLNNPLPERFVRLLRQLDVREQPVVQQQQQKQPGGSDGEPSVPRKDSGPN
jgi:Anti-sigma factor NepR